MKKFLFNYFIFSFFFFAFFASGFVDSQDGLQYLAIARRIYYDQTIAMPEANYEDHTNIHFNAIEKEDGKRYAPTGLGYSIALLPAVALEDLFLRIGNLEKIDAFPLQNDWPVLLFASMTNSVFGALFIVSFYYFLTLLNVKHSTSVQLSFLLTISSSIFIYSKHTFAHMMFVSFMFLCFIFIKKYSLVRNRVTLLYSGIMFGIMLLSYNATYLVIIPSIVLYYLFLNFNYLKNKLSTAVLDASLFFIGILPFYLLNAQYTAVTKSSWAVKHVDSTIAWIKPYVFVEGFWGTLFSPGKSIFLYSPILILIIIFWHKLDFKKFKAEIITGTLLFLSYFVVIGTLMGGEDYLLWHGDSSFGNRYMLATVPFFLVFVSLIYIHLSKKIKIFIFYPILFISIMVQIVGISQPYQIKFAGLQSDVQFNGRNFNVYEYGNIIPRYSPLLSMSKKFVRKILDLKVTFISSKNKIEFFDGFGYPFGSNNNYWRSVEELAFMRVPNNSKVAIKFVNHQIIPTSSYSAQIEIKNQDQNISQVIDAGSEKIIEVDTHSDILSLNKSFVGTSSANMPENQVVFITQAWVNDESQNLNTINYPYVSPISKSLSNIEYYYWGNKQLDPWSIWHMHSGVYEKTFDFWWLRPAQYWDLPKDIFISLLFINTFGIIYFGYITLVCKAQ